MQLKRLLSIPEEIRLFLPLAHFLRGTDIGALYAQYNRQVYRTYTKPHSRAKVLAWILIFPFHLTIAAFSATWKNGPVVKRVLRKGLVSQFLQQVSLCMRYSIRPSEYYLYRFFEPHKEAVASKWVSVDLWRLVERINIGPDQRAVNHKDRFAEHCSKSGVPHIPIVAVLSDSSFRMSAMAGNSYGRSDLFVKINSAASGGGKGHFFVVYDDGRYCWDGHVCDGENVFASLAEYCGAGEYIVQPRVRTVRELADLSPEVLATLRVVTIRRSEGRIDAHRVLLKLQGQSEFVDNLILGGLGTPVNLESGELGPAVSCALWWKTHSSDPGTGCQIEGRKVPFLKEAIDLCKETHRTIDVPLIGWDVGLTDAGPVLVEANRAPSIELMQWPFDEGIGGTNVCSTLHELAQCRFS